MSTLQKLTEKEEEVMTFIWQHGQLTIRQILELYPDPKPHFNTTSTYVHFLERKGYLSRTKVGNALVYSPIISVEEYRRDTMKGVIRRFFDNSYMKIVSALVKEENVSIDELKELIDIAEKNKQIKG